MNENVAKFFELYDSDPALRERLKNDEALYPGSLEIRESVVEAVLLPVAAELGFVFTVDDLRRYEKTLKACRSIDELSDDGSEDIDEEVTYWIIDHGWENNEAAMCGENKGE